MKHYYKGSKMIYKFNHYVVTGMVLTCPNCLGYFLS